MSDAPKHPGHFFICVWLYFITMNSCDTAKHTRELNETIVKIGKSIAKTDNGSGAQ